MISVLLPINQNKLSAINIQYQNNSHKSFQNPLGAEWIKSPPQDKGGKEGGEE
jgi:hypothetical protein